jgi:drug/metabolite transporter (DMT)-like permease
LIVSLIWSLTPVLDKECLKYTGVYLHGFLQSFGMLLLFPLILLNSKNYKLTLMKKIHYDLTIFLIVILGFLTAFIQLMALQYVFVAELEALKRGIGIALSLGFGYFIFKEEVNLKKIFSVIIIICGVNFIINFTKFTNLQIIM